MTETEKIVLTSDEDLYYIVATLVERAKRMGHGKITFNGIFTIHAGKVVELLMSEDKEGSRIRGPSRAKNHP